MEIDVSYPVMARAMRKGFRGECRLLASRQHRQEVAAVSSRDTQQATSSVLVENARGDIAAAPPLRLYNDRLFRFIAPLQGKNGLMDIGLSDVTARAFGNPHHDSLDYVFTTLGRNFCDKNSRNPLSRPVFSVFRDRLEALAMTDTHHRNKTFPKGTGWNSYEQNEDAEFDALAAESLWVSRDDVEEAFDMHRAQSGRLLVIDDGLWYETRPPCIAVETHWQNYKPGESSVIVRYRYLPDTMDQTPSTRYFPLHALEQARETASLFKSEFKMSGIIDKLPEFDTPDHDAFDFDTVENLVTRTGQAVAMTLLYYRAIRPDKIDGVTDRWLDGISEMFHRHNPVLGRDADFASVLPDLVENYLRLLTPKYGGLNKLQKVELRKFLPKVVDMLDDMPVSVHGLGVAPSFTP